MALLFCESFDHSASGTGPNAGHFITGKWTSFSSGTDFILETGRTSLALRYRNANQLTAAKDNLPARETFIIGFATMPGLGALVDHLIFSIDNGTGSGLTVAQGIGVVVATTGSATGSPVDLKIVRRDTGAVIATAAGVLSNGDLYRYVELKVSSAAGGVVQCRVDGVLVIDTTNPQAGTATYNRIHLIHESKASAHNQRWDDLYVCDTLGTANNDFLGDVRIECINPIGNGDFNEWTNSSGDSLNNWQKIASPSAAPNTTTWSQADAVGERDYYLYSNLTFAGNRTVSGVQVVSRAEAKDGAGLRMAHVARLAGVELLGDDMTLLLDTPRDRMTIFETKPGGGSWSAANIDDAFFGSQGRA